MSELANTEALESNLVEGVPMLELPPESEPFPLVQGQLIGEGSFFVVAGAAVVAILGLGALSFMANFYKVPQASEAYVITGVGCKDGYRVIMGGGTIIMPVLNQLTRVPLTQYEIPAEVELFTEDPLKVKVQAKVYVKVNGVEKVDYQSGAGSGQRQGGDPKSGSQSRLRTGD